MRKMLPIISAALIAAVFAASAGATPTETTPTEPTTTPTPPQECPDGTRPTTGGGAPTTTCVVVNEPCTEGIDGSCAAPTCFSGQTGLPAKSCKGKATPPDKATPTPIPMLPYTGLGDAQVWIQAGIICMLFASGLALRWAGTHGGWQ